MKHAIAWMNLEYIMLSERSQALRVISYDSTDMKYPTQMNPQRQTTDWWLPGVKGEGKQKLFNG